MAPTKSTTIHFDKDILNLIYKPANLASKTTAEFICNPVLDKLENRFDYQASKNDVRIVNFLTDQRLK